MRASWAPSGIVASFEAEDEVSLRSTVAFTASVAGGLTSAEVIVEWIHPLWLPALTGCHPETVAPVA